MITQAQRQVLACFILGQAERKTEALQVHNKIMEAYPEYVSGPIGRYMDAVDRGLELRLQEQLRRQASTCIMTS